MVTAFDGKIFSPAWLEGVGMSPDIVLLPGVRDMVSDVTDVSSGENQNHHNLVNTTSDKSYLIALGWTSPVLGDRGVETYVDFYIYLLFNFDPLTSYLLSKHLTFQLFPHLRHKDFVIFS